MDDTMTVAQSLRHARHDFLNELQLIKMNVDLGRSEQVQAIIRTHAEAAVQLDRLACLGVPETEQWILTAKWRFPEIRFRLDCQAQKAPVQADRDLANLLELLMQTIRGQLEPIEQIECHLTCTNEPQRFLAAVQVDGDWRHVKLPESEEIQVGRACVSAKTEFVFSAQMEG